MKGVQFVIDEKGEKTAVILDLATWGELWEDLYDAMVSRERMNEPTVPWKELKAELELETARRERV